MNAPAVSLSRRQGRPVEPEPFPPQMTADPARNFGASLRYLRKARGWPQRELAARAGVSCRMVSDAEQGRSTPGLFGAVLLAQALESSVDAMCGRFA